MVTGRCSEEIPVNHQLGSHQKMLHSSATSIVSFDLLYQQEQVKRNSVACSASRSPAWPFNGDLHFTLDHSKVYCLTAFSLIAVLLLEGWRKRTANSTLLHYEQQARPPVPRRPSAQTTLQFSSLVLVDHFTHLYSPKSTLSSSNNKGTH